MAGKMIVLVADRDDPRHGEVTVLADGRKAERLVETLLEAGFERERIRIFSGAELDVQVTQRPVVSLVADGAAGSPDADEAEAEEAIAAQEETAGSEEEEEEKAPAEAVVQNGVRFSSLFRSA